MTKRILGFAALAALAFMPIAAQEATTPEYKWVKGATAHYRLDIQKVSKVSGAQQAEIDQTWFYLFDTEVKDVAPDGAATVQVKFGSAGVHFQIPAKNIDFTYDPGNPDDEKRAASPLAVPFVAIGGETITYKVAKTGKLLGLEGLQELFQKIGEKVKAAPQGANYYGIAMTALDDLRTSQVETMFRRLPEKPLKAGEATYKTPKIRESNPAVGNLLLQSDCSIKAANPGAPADAWSIACEIARTPEPPAAGTPAPPGKLIETKVSSDFVLSKNGGEMIKNVYKSVMAVEQALPAAPNAAPGAPAQTVTQRDEVTATLERQEAAPAAPPAAPAAPPAGS